MTRSKWDQRIERAEALGVAHPFAAEAMRFYKRIASLQKELYLSLEKTSGENNSGSYSKSSGNGLLISELNFNLLLPRFPLFLSDIESEAPERIAESARDLKAQTPERWKDLLASHWQNASHFEPASGDTESLIAWMFLQPYAEYLADHRATVPTNGSLAICPACSARPLVGVLRPEGDGAKRSLICSVCATEWPYRRIVCPACGEETVEKLAVYTADQFKHVRVEACDTCRYYIKTVDLTKNGHAVPVVDELATIPLNLWAQEHQYAKLRANLLGI